MVIIVLYFLKMYKYDHPVVEKLQNVLRQTTILQMLRGEYVVAVAGAPGAGKSTLMRLLYDLHNPDISFVSGRTGRGERLRPLTRSLPKPLLPVAGRPLLAWTLERLRAVGCEAVAINLHHLGSQIRDTIGESFREDTKAAAKNNGDLRGAMQPLLQIGDSFIERSHNNIPAIQADMKLARVPAATAFMPKRARSDLRLGARAPMPPIWMAMELKLAKPQRA